MKQTSLVLSLAVVIAGCGGGGTAAPGGPDGAAGTAGGAGATGAGGGGGAAGSAGLAGASGRGGTGVAGAGGGAGAAGRGGGAGGRGGGSGGAAGVTGAAGTAGGRGGAGGTLGAAGRGGTGGPAGGAGSGGTGGGASAASFYIGADITWVQADEARGATYSDGAQKEILQLLKDHGFNAIRLRTFVDPRAADGYDRQNGYGDLAHTITFGKRIKAAGMAFLVDFHYSDNWADPGKQCVPVAWQTYTTIAQLATAVHDYTRDAISQLVAAGARPDMVQVGNEITPGMLIHRCDSGGLPTGENPVTGKISSWPNLGMLLKAGVAGVKEVDPTIPIMLHIDRGDEFAFSRDFIRSAMTQGVEFQVFGESCYTAYQGPPSGWRSTFTRLAEMFPDLKFVVAEYGPEQRAANDVMYEMPNQRGLGTFNWEPTHPGAWNRDHALFDVSGNRHTATADLALYDAMKTAYAPRL